MSSTKFRSVFGEYIGRYVELRRGFGLRFIDQANMLRLFDNYVYGLNYTGLLTQDLAIGFATSNPDNTSGQWARRYSTVKHFSDFLSTLVPETPLLDPNALHSRRSYRPAYIYTEEEIAMLLELAAEISPKNPLRGVTLHAMIALATGTGMRISEVVNLDRDDVNLATGVLRIRCTKFFKERIVPVHRDVLDVLKVYANTRDATLNMTKSMAFFLHLYGRRFSKHTLQLSFWDLTRRAGMRGDSGEGPTFHDLRHTFAVRRLIAWYREGKDVQAMLPVLATYMGHVHYTSTAHYITAVPELMELAAERFHGIVFASKRCPE